LLGTRHHLQQFTHSLIDSENARTMADTSWTCLPHSYRNTTISSSITTEPCVNGWLCDETFSSQICPSSETYVSSTSMSEEPTRDHKRKRAQDDDPLSVPTTPVCIGTVAPARRLQNNVSTDTSVPTAIALTTSMVPVPTNPKRARIGASAVKQFENCSPEGVAEGYCYSY
jgi:hypothetical protein